MSRATKLRRGEGPVWGRLKKVSLAALRFHIPVSGTTRPAFAALACKAVVTKDVTPDVVVAGNPARVVEHLAHDGAGGRLVEQLAGGPTP
jgi:hypothetical protein